MHGMGGDELLRTLYYAILAGFGGIMGYTMRTLDKGQKLSITRGSIEASASAFVGVITMLTCRAMGLDELWTGAIVGAFGWMGANASFAVVEKVIRKRLGVDDNA